VRQEVLGTQEHPTQIHGDFPIPFFHASVLDGLTGYSRGIIEKHVNFRESAESYLENVQDGLRPENINLHG
jgi:hypothetical protein